MRKIAKLFFLLVVFLITSTSVFAANLTISGATTHTISSNVTYDLVIVQDQASLIVANGAVLTVTGCLVGYDDSAFLVVNGTIDGRINIESSRKFHLLNTTLVNTEAAPTNSIIHSDSIIIASSTITATGPIAPYFTPGGQSNIEFYSDNDVFVRDTDIVCTGGIGTGGYYGPKPDGAGKVVIETASNIYIENGSELSATGCFGQVRLTGNIVFVFDSLLNAYGKSGANGTITIESNEINNQNNFLYAEGGDGMPGSIHGAYIYAMPTNGGSGCVNITAKTVNLASDTIEAAGSDGGFMPPNPSGVSSGGPGNAYITITSTENTESSLYNNTFSFSGPGSHVLTITPSSINGATAPTVEIPRLVLENFEDDNLWSPETTMGWWDVDDMVVYQHYLVEDKTHSSIRTMKTDYNKSGYAWSLFGGFIDPANPNRDFSSFNTVRVWAQGNTELLVKLRDGSYTEGDIAKISTESSSGIIPLDFNYSGISSVNTSNIDNVLFFAAPGESGSTGIFYIDSVELVNTVKIDNFEDGDMWSPDSTLGWWDIDGTAVYNRSIVSSPRHEGEVCMRVDYNKSGRAWSLFAGSISSANNNKDFSGYRKITFWLYGDVALLVKLRDRTFNEEDITTVSGVAGQWTYIEVDFTGLSIDLSDVDNILFFAAPGDGGASGTFYIDDLALIE